MSKFRLKNAGKKWSGVPYHVSATGDDDTGDGSIGAPYQTITKANALVLDPGDSVLLKRGDTFTGPIIPAYSGTSGAWIRYGTYGSGARPVIDGSADRGVKIAITNTNHHLRFESLDFNGSMGSYIGCVDAHSHDLYFDDCIGHNSAGGFGFSTYTVSGSVIYNVVYHNCQAYDNYLSGIFVGSEDGLNHDCFVTYCIAHNNGQIAWHDHGIYVKFGVTVSYCICYDNIASGIKTNDQGIYTSAYHPVVNGNICYSTTQGAQYWGIYIGEQYSTVTNNLCYKNISGIAIDEHYGYFYYNTLVNNSYSGFAWSAKNTTGAVYKNNLVIQDSGYVGYGYCYHASTSADLAFIAANNVFDHNVLYRDGNAATAIGLTYTGTLTYTMAQWQALTGFPDAGGTLLTAAPGIVTRYSSFHPATGENLIGLAEPLVDCLVDAEGMTRDGTNPNPGCYETASEAIPYPPINVNITHDGGDLSEYTTTVTNGGKITVTVGAAMRGSSHGMEVLIDSLTAIYAEYGGMLNGDEKLRVRFYFDINTLTMASGATHDIFHIRTAGTDLAKVLIEKSGSNYTLRLYRILDGGGSISGLKTITDAPHYIEIYVWRASSNVAADGGLQWWIDDGLQDSYTTDDNYDTHTIYSAIRTGAPYHIDAGTSGPYFIDEIVINSTGNAIGA